MTLQKGFGVWRIPFCFTVPSDKHFGQDNSAPVRGVMTSVRLGQRTGPTQDSNQGKTGYEPAALLLAGAPDELLVRFVVTASKSLPSANQSPSRRARTPNCSSLSMRDERNGSS